MSSAMKTILVIGGTSGIGEAMAKRWYSQGKKLVITGRREQKLLELEKSLPGTKTYVMDNTQLAKLPEHVNSIFSRFPDIDTVWINSGISTMWSIKDSKTGSDQTIIDEVTTNITGPMILARHFIPKLIAKDAPVTFIITGSALGFVPNPWFPTYPASKAYIHHFMSGLRAALQGTKVNVIELVPPMVATDLHSSYSEQAKYIPQMSLQEYVDETFQILDNTKPSEIKEVPAGGAKERVQAWRDGTGKFMLANKING